jgi:hypothetical protein
MQRSPSRNNAQKFNVERNERNSSASATPPLAPLSLADDVAELCFKRTVEFRAAERDVAVGMLPFLAERSDQMFNANVRRGNAQKHCYNVSPSHFDLAMLSFIWAFAVGAF